MISKDTDEEVPSLIEKGARFLKRFWFLRGFVAAFALLGLCSEYLDLTQWEFARVVHALVVSWNEAMGWIGKVLATLFGIPEIDRVFINVALIITSTIIPASYAVYQAPDLNFKRGFFGKKGFYVTVSFLLLSMIGKSWSIKLNDGHDSLPIWMALSAIMCIIIASQYLKSFGRGVLYVISLLLVVEVVYWMPFFGDFLAAFADGVLGADRPAD